MERNREYYLGVFDLLKGYLMIAIFMVHTLVIIEFLLQAAIAVHPGLAIVERLVYQVPLLLNAAIILLFMVSGFGFRQAAMGATVKKQAGTILVPYLITSVVATILYAICHFKVLGSTEEWLYQIRSHALGYLIGVTDTNLIPNGAATCVAAIWYLLALFIAWNLLNIIMNLAPQKAVIPICIAVTVAGYLLAVTIQPQFCLSQGMVGVTPLYFGYRIREDKLLLKKHPWWVFVLLGIGSAISICFGTLKLANYTYDLGILEIPLAGCTAYLLMYLAVAIDGIEGWVPDKLRTIGRYSLWILCVHTIEIKALPWYSILGLLPDNLLLDIIIMFAIRCVLIYIMFEIVMWFEKKKTAREKAKRKAAREAKRAAAAVEADKE